MRTEYEDVIEVTPALLSLEALLPGGLNALPNRVRRALERDDYSEALAAANSAYSAGGPADRDAALAYAILLVGRLLIDEALGVLRKALTFHAQDVAMQLAQAEALVVQEDFASATALLEGMRAVSTLEPRHWSFVGDMYLDMGDDDEAMDCYRQALHRGQKSAEVAYRLAQLLDEQGDANGAAHYLQLAARIAGDNPMLWEAAADACFEADQLEDAAYAFEQLVDHRPFDDQCWLMLGLTYWCLERPAEAAQAFEQLVELNPQHFIGWSHLGDCRLTMGLSELALDAFRNALELEQENVETLLGASIASSQLGDMESALRWAEQALGLEPANARARFRYGLILLDLSRGSEAVEVLQPLVDAGEGELEKFLGALAVAQLMNGKLVAAFEHIGEAERLEVEGHWLLAFTEELLRVQGIPEAMAYLERTGSDEPTWKVIRPLLSYVCSGLITDDDAAGRYADEFYRAICDEPQVVPVLWDLESWEAFAYRLEPRFEAVFDSMLGIVEGRREIEEMKDHIS